ncbi:MAG: hypothetical protein QME12_07720 [Nanoarchaeota archaeon]|nr:hypothetical protein [Nanoarchaeota archaeon]
MKIEKVTENLDKLKAALQDTKVLTFPLATSIIGERRDNILRLFYLMENENLMFLPGKAPVPSVLFKVDEVEKQFCELLKDNLDSVDSFGQINDLIPKLIERSEAKGLSLTKEEIALLTRKFLRKYRIDAKIVPFL